MIIKMTWSLCSPTNKEISLSHTHKATKTVKVKNKPVLPP
jgi:hypothetical protein